MATLRWTVPDLELDRVLAALAARYDYKPLLADGRPNPETPAQFVQRMVADDWRRQVVEHELRLAREAVPRPVDPDIAKAT